MRLFIAIDFNEQIKSTLFDLSSQLMRQADTGRPVPAENYHLTLAFIGQTERLQEVQQALATACRSHFTQAIQLSFQGIGSFRGRKGHTWWVGIKDNPALSLLANRITDQLRLAGFNIEARTFKPHITIGRAVVTSRPISLQLPPITFEAHSISLMRSELRNGRAHYHELYACDIHEGGAEHADHLV